MSEGEEEGDGKEKDAENIDKGGIDTGVEYSNTKVVDIRNSEKVK